MIHVGFTGTRHGVTIQQRIAIERLVDELSAREPLIAHHGDCEGADSVFHDICRDVGAFLVGHPPDRSEFRAHRWCDELRPVAPYLKRNRHIVAAADIVIAAPYESSRQRRGGTWHAIALAEHAGKPLAIVWPDGRVEYSEAWGMTRPIGRGDGP